MFSRTKEIFKANEKGGFMCTYTNALDIVFYPNKIILVIPTNHHFSMWLNQAWKNCKGWLLLQTTAIFLLAVEAVFLFSPFFVFYHKELLKNIRPKIFEQKL